MSLYTGILLITANLSFSDHCFTRKPVPEDDRGLAYPASDRQPGHFCFDRYHLSLGLKVHIARAVLGNVWTVEGGSYAAVPTINHAGAPAFYGIVFSLDRVKGLQVHLQMRVKTAHPCGGNPPATFGSVRFRHLVALRMKNEVPGRITDKRRKIPRLS